MSGELYGLSGPGQRFYQTPPPSSPPAGEGGGLDLAGGIAGKLAQTLLGGGGSGNSLIPDIDPLGFVETILSGRWLQLDRHETEIQDAIALGNSNAAAIADLSVIAAAAKATQAWVGNYTDMASVPRSLLIPAYWGGSHDHTVSDGASYTGTASLSGGIPSYSPSVTKITSNGTIYFTPIISDRSGNLDKFRFITGADRSLFSIDAYNVALMIWDIPAGVFRTIWNPGDIKNSMGSSLSEVSISMGLAGAAAEIAPGQVLIAAHQQIAPGLAQTARSVAWVPQPGVARTSDVLIPGCYWQTSSNVANGIPTTVTVSSLSSRTGGIPWYAVSVTNS